jgi:hypothetical protein
MTIHLDPPFFADILCDECGEEERLDFNQNEATFYKLNQDIKDLGWIIQKEKGEFNHYCGDCTGYGVR